MVKYSFNSLLFSRLTDVLDISGAEIARRSGLTQQVLNRYMNNEIGVSVQVLMKICNSLRMPIHYFVSEDNNHIIPNRESATIPVERWRPVEWDRQAAELTFGDGEGKIFWKDVAEVMGVSPQKPHERFLLRTRFPMDDFLNTCSSLEISPYRFLTGQSPKETAARTGGRVTRQAEIVAMNKMICELSASVADLSARYRTLLDRHNRLENQVREYLGLDASLGKASEDR